MPSRKDYMEHARWWRKHSLESANPKECLWYAENMELLSNHMQANPPYYQGRPAWHTDWEWFKKFHAQTKSA